MEADAVQIFEPVHAFVDARLSGVLVERAGAASAAVAGPLRAALVLYIVLYGYAIFRGAIAEPVVDFSIRSLKLVFIYAIAATPAYSAYVTAPLFSTLPDELAQAVTGGQASSVGAAFDEVLNYGGYLGARNFAAASIADPGPWIVGGVVMICGAVAAALGFGVTLLAKIALALLVALGPIFIALALFEATRRWFFGWLSQGVNYLVLFALALTLAQLTLDLVRSQWSNIEGQHPVVGGVIFMALCALAGFFFLQLPTLSTGIAGGASLGLATFASPRAQSSERTGRGEGSFSQSTPEMRRP